MMQNIAAFLLYLIISLDQNMGTQIPAPLVAELSRSSTRVRALASGADLWSMQSVT